MTRRLIVNADDFGHSPEVNAGIVEAHEGGIVTSASLMVRRPAAAEAAQYAGALAVGLHVELGEWTFASGEWRGTGQVPHEGVEEEVRAQLERFCALRGHQPTHLDSHQHVHRDEPARSVLRRLGAELGVPVRDFHPGIRYLGGFYGQTDTGEPWHEGVTAEHLISLIRALPGGTTELGCHPARGTPPGTTYAVERALELSALCDRRVREAIEQEDVKLISFADVASLCDADPASGE